MVSAIVVGRRGGGGAGAGAGVAHVPRRAMSQGSGGRRSSGVARHGEQLIPWLRQVLLITALCFQRST